MKSRVLHNHVPLCLSPSFLKSPITLIFTDLGKGKLYSTWQSGYWTAFILCCRISAQQISRGNAIPLPWIEPPYNQPIKVDKSRTIPFPQKAHLSMSHAHLSPYKSPYFQPLGHSSTPTTNSAAC
ncbi:hypothetical protein A0H81_00942 [Grifola frondosa]|uniref:Uncharacterized protein n=1 Tax=Grifola frondosa TaxID=5627 RepID=A0A1C7MQY1_GRIFR|nr:hypothetical protein A0H81_00942 [Grifola frondosa]